MNKGRSLLKLTRLCNIMYVMSHKWHIRYLLSALFCTCTFVMWGWCIGEGAVSVSETYMFAEKNFSSQVSSACLCHMVISTVERMTCDKTGGWNFQSSSKLPGYMKIVIVIVSCTSSYKKEDWRNVRSRRTGLPKKLSMPNSELALTTLRLVHYAVGQYSSKHLKKHNHVKMCEVKFPLYYYAWTCMYVCISGPPGLGLLAAL
jgi:hypothetical protein